MRTKAQVLQEHYGVSTLEEMWPLMSKDHDTLGPQPPLDQWVTSIKLPYEAPEHPGIPSIEEIYKGMLENKLTHPTGLFAVCRVGKCVVKIGADKVILQEAENLLYLQEHSQVRTPKLYAAFTRFTGEYDTNYLVTEFIEGDTLSEKKWLALDPEAQKMICAELSEQFRLLRSIPYEGEGYYGRVFHQGWSPWITFLCIRCKDMCGPFDTFNDFISAMYATAELRMADSNTGKEYHPNHLNFLSGFKPVLGGTTGYKPVLTHMDPKFENIIIRCIKEEDEETVKSWEVTLIDWDSLGWLPAFMQFAALDERIMLFDEHRKGFFQGVFANFEESYTAELEFLHKAYNKAHYLLL